MGEAVLVLLGLGLAAYVLVGPLVAMLTAHAASKRAQALEARVRQLESDLAWERRNQAAMAAAWAQQQRGAAAPATEAKRPIVAAPAFEPEAPIVGGPTIDEADAIVGGPTIEPGEAVGADPAGGPVVAGPTGEVIAAGPAMEAPLAASAPVAPPSSAGEAGPLPSAEPTSLEERLGLTWLTRIGAAAFVLGALFFFKYAVDSAWIGPWGRVAVGGVVGVVLLVLAEAAAPKSRPGFVQALTGIGLAVLFASVWASAALYALVAAPVAFIAATVVLLLGAALARRRRGEAVLVIALVAGFANPVVLSTGQDRPLELFAYLLLVTTVALAVATELRFRFVPWLCVAGTAALFGGWYERFFDTRDLRDTSWQDVPEAELVGAYLALSSRVVPLVSAALFGAQWVLAALRLRAKGAPAAVSKALGVSGLVLAHAAAALLLYDSPRLLAGVATGLALASIAALTALDAASLLLLPMGAAFVAFVGVSSRVSQADRAVLVSLLGGWTAVYLAGFVRGQHRALRAAATSPIEPAAAIRAVVALALFVFLAALLLVDAHPALFAFILAASSAVAALIAARSGVAAILVGASIATTIAMLAAAAPMQAYAPVERPDADPVFLGAVALWTCAYLGAVAWRALGARREVTWTAVITGSIAVAGFLATALLSTSGEVPTLRALLTAGAGVADLGLGLVMLRAPPGRRDLSAVLLGQALALFAAAIAFGLSGAPITVLWAALATVAASIAARTREPTWIAVAALLFGAALVRLGAVDALAAMDADTRYFGSLGRDGQPGVPLLWNARAYGLAGVGAALLVAARLASRGVAGARGPAEGDDARGLLRTFAIAAASLGYALLVALAVTETRTAFTTYPPLPPMPLDATEWYAFRDELVASRGAQAGSLAMLTTLVLGLSAAALLVAGFAARDALHRVLGLLLFVLTVAKLALWDVWNVERIYQIVLLTGVGALLVAGGFLYARFGARIVALMREGSDRDRPPSNGAGPAVVLLLLLTARSAQAQAPALAVETFELQRPVAGVTAPGDHRFAVDVELYRGSKGRGLLDDLRVAGPDGAEVPYVLREIAPTRVARTYQATVLDAGVLEGGAAQATLALSVAAGRHCRAVLLVRGDTFLRRTRVETGESPQRFATVAEGGYVYRIPSESGGVERLVVDYPASQQPYVRVTLLVDDRAGRAAAPGFDDAVRIEGGHVGCPAPETNDPVDEVPLAIEGVTRDAETKQTVVTLDAGGEGVPLEAVRLDVETPELQRRVSVSATSYRSVWPAVGSGVIYRVKPRDGFVLAETRVPVATTRKRWLRVVIDDEDSAPLVIRGASGEVRRREVVLRASRAGEHLLYVGDANAYAPSYDFAAILAQAPRDAAPTAVTLGATTKSARFGAPAVAASLPWTEEHRGPVGIALAALLVGLSLWTVRILRQKGPAATDG